MSVPSLVYYYPAPASFVTKDLDILQKAYRVHAQDMPHFKQTLLPWLFLRQLGHLLWYLPKAKLCVVQFASYHALLPALVCKLFGKPLLIVTGGTDTRRVPEIGYGNFNKPFLGTVTALTLRLATAIAPVHQSLSKTTYTYLGGKPSLQGIYNLVPNLHTPSFTIYNGFSATAFAPTIPPEDRPAKSLITVAGDLSTPVKQKTKGIDVLLEAAALLPDFSFTIVGRAGMEGAPANITWIKWVNPSNLPGLLSKHRFYGQLSATEGFPNALAEGMLCACVPIGSEVAAVPFIMGPSGYVLPHRDGAQLAQLLREADQNYTSDRALEARQRIVQYFGIDVREERLLALCKALEGHALPNSERWEAGLSLPDPTHA
jgi:glycosyltransferase involved in cell wall biosynthesis